MTGQAETADRSESRPAGDTRAKILATARELFLRNGYAGTSMVSIGKALGISAQALYWHFRSKEALVFALVEEPLADFAAAVDNPAPDPADRLSNMVRDYVLYQLARQHDLPGYTSLARVAQSGHILSPEHQATLRKMQHAIYRRYLATLNEGADAGVFRLADPVATAFAIISMCEHVNDWARPEGRLAPAEVAGEYVRLALRMAGARTGR
ncbi:TetR/AcrR family transcriptional regulator [Amycolatopsis sp. WGS_07]|uniref:TetR/AcrR family transcriptional regulator n=1 Tax=Amycolatopsis sp. WGS_07 TaxID=3076764 RepID=UPI003872FF6A